ncbi:glutathione synthetase [Pelagibaculum spongiae]|uniref:Glutathione synthetase n=1 Tax=Pelagibaculum spongiae TaxID=2080658 RepID=A0A2V1GSZ9_9GAMM|nr:glutathione synthetase [Pelagibaculum spongiae]PVZ65641.1 glutathione synthetase [Pelagibaculum spongiae]
MKICFLMYPWQRISPETDTTLRLIHESAARGHTVAICTPGNLTMRESIVYGFCDVLVRGDKKLPEKSQVFYKNAQFKRSKLPMGGFDAIFMRANPPLEVMSLNFLDSVKQDTFIMNSLEGLRVANNKLYTASFSGAANRFVPATHVSKNRDYLERVLLDSDSERMILKPLNGFGGKGVIVLEKSAKKSFKSLLDFYIGDDPGNYVILQEYVEGAELGDIRVLMLNGQAIGAMRRIPAEDDVRSNIHAGGREVKHILTPEQLALCQAIGPKLVADGLHFVGLDLIGDKLIEVNVMSPGGITRINRLNRCKLQKQVMDFIEAQVVLRENEAADRAHKVHLKTTLRQVITDADAN